MKTEGETGEVQLRPRDRGVPAAPEARRQAQKGSPHTAPALLTAWFGTSASRTETQ